MSSNNISKIKSPQNDKSKKTDIKDAEDILKKGVENIYQSFNLTHKTYKDKISLLEKDVNNLTQKLETLKKEIEMIQRENKYYKEKNEKLTNEIDKMNKIVNNIKGKLTDDEAIDEIIKNDKKYYNQANFSKYKHNGNYLYNIYKNNAIINNTNTTKNGKSKMINYFMNNNNDYNDVKYLKKNNTENNYIKNKNYINERKENNDDSFINLKLDINNKIYTEDRRKNRYPNSFSYKYRTACISRDDLIKTNNYMDKSEDLHIDSSTSNIKSINKNLSTNKIISIPSENKKLFEDREINNDDINVKELNNISNNYTINNNISKKHIRKLDHKICLTYDNLFNNKKSKEKEIKKKKHSYYTFRGKIFNKNHDNTFEKNNKNSEIDFFLNKCYMILDKELADKIAKIFQDYKEGLITEKGIVFTIKNYIGNINELVEIFNKIFIK